MASGIVPPPTHSFPTYARNVFGTKAGMKTTAQLIGFDFQLRFKPKIVRFCQKEIEMEDA